MQGGTEEMTLEKAIKVLTDMGTPHFQGSTEDILKARKLGIEALKRLQDNRRDPEFDHWIPLPGETESPS
jgi:hypothetical protein